MSAKSATALKAAAAGSSVRLAFLVWGLDAEGRPTLPARAIVPLAAKDVAVLTKP